MDIDNHDNIAWNIIDKFFEDKNVLIKHHLESYNDFFNNQIYNIINEKNPIQIFKEQDPETKEYKLQADIYIGGISGNRLYFGKPVIFDESREHFMFPNEARLRNMSYATTLHIDVEIIYKIINEDNEERKEKKILEKIYFGKFPIMLNSDLCILNKLDETIKFNMGECKNDRGGYFIIDGKEKVLISQEKFADNMFYIRDNYNEIYSHSAEIRSVSEDSSKPVRTLSIRIVRESLKYTNNNIVVNIPNVRKPIPLFILMRALGIESDKEIIEFCLLDLERYEEYIDLFIPSIHDAGYIFNQEVALKYMATFTKGKTIPHILEILMDYLLPHIGEDNFIDKAYFLGYMTNELLKVYKGHKKPTDRDSFKYKRVELAGSLIYGLFKEYYTLQQKHIYQKIDKEYYYKQAIYQDNFISLIENNYNEYFKEKILESGFKKAFKGNWGSQEHTHRPEVIQDLNRLSYNSFMSHLRKLNLPLDSSAKVVGPRLLHSSQWGLIDPVDTPDGGNIGLHKHMAISCHITSGYSSKNIIELLKSVVFVELLSECRTDYIGKYTKIFVNGAWIGIVTRPVDVLDILKKYRRLGLIPIYTSISWSISDNIIYIYTDSGRLCRPIFYIDNYEASYKKSYIYDKLLSNEFNYSDLLIGFNEFSDKINIENKEIFINKNQVFSDIFSLYNKNQISEEVNSVLVNNPNNILNNSKLLDKLLEKAGIIDYIDTAESESALISVNPEDIKKYSTHLEIHPSLLLGIMGNQIVFPENNQLPRDLFSCGQSKQAVSLYNSNYQNRIDKLGVVLNNGQIPLIKSRYLKYINNEEHPCGINAIVAIGCYGGYNVEDSILFNEGSLKRGMFNTTYFNMYESREESSKVGTSVVDSQFSNIEKKNVIGKKPGYDYSLLDENGIIKENTKLHDKVVLIGKTNTNINNPENYIDSSITPKKGQLGYVDKSFITEEEEGFRIAKVRIREERVPAIGDKFCSRCGQKGTIGLVIPEKDMPFNDEGIRPDLIINPHALPSRMTIGQLVETILGKTCLIYGGFGDCTAFINKGPKHEIYGNLLRNIGYNSSGNEILYNGETGEQLKMEVFIGPCYYMRLKHMVKDKINFRAQGPRTVLTRQTVQGRANDGGLRIGEMERDSIIAHGATQFLKESMLVRGDNYYMAICNNTGTIAIYNESKNIFISPYADGPIKFKDNINNDKNIEVMTKYGRSFSIVRVPYTFKLLMQELQTMNIQMRVITEDNIDQLTSMNYENTIKHLSKNVLNKKQKTEFMKFYRENVHGINSKYDENSDAKTQQLEYQDEKPEDGEEGNKEDNESDDNEGLSDVTIESIKKAEEDYKKYKELDSDEDDEDDEEDKPQLTIGDQISNALNSFVEVLTNKDSNEDSKKEDSKEKELYKELDVEDIEDIQDDIKDDIKDDSDDKKNVSILSVDTEVNKGDNIIDEKDKQEYSNDSSNIKKTIKIDQQ